MKYNQVNRYKTKLQQLTMNLRDKLYTPNYFLILWNSNSINRYKKKIQQRTMNQMDKLYMQNYFLILWNSN